MQEQESVLAAVEKEKEERHCEQLHSVTQQVFFLRYPPVLSLRCRYLKGIEERIVIYMYLKYLQSAEIKKLNLLGGHCIDYWNKLIKS